MTVKAVLFDLDGVLIDSDNLHFSALNMALENYELPPICPDFHAKELKGLPTCEKLKILVSMKLFPELLTQAISTKKQEFTTTLLKTLKPIDIQKASLLKCLRSRGIKIAVCSNSLKNTIVTVLRTCRIYDYVDLIVSQEDVSFPKPAPDIYLHAMSILSLNTNECLIVEDSDIGYQSAVSSGAHAMRIQDTKEVNTRSILEKIALLNEVNVLIPAAGLGSRFANKGYDMPKPLIDVLGKPMIEWVIDNVRAIGKPLLLFQNEDIEDYEIKDTIAKIHKDAIICPVYGQTEGALCTALKARNRIKCDKELLILNSDQYLEFDLAVFLDYMRSLDVDGGILCFAANDPKWSFAAVDQNGYVVEVAEKKVISKLATTGVYYFKRGSDFVKSSDQLISKNTRVNGEFYICPVFNEMIALKKKIAYYEIPAKLMHGLGTPEDLEKFLEYHQRQDVIRYRVKEVEQITV